MSYDTTQRNVTVASWHNNAVRVRRQLRRLVRRTKGHRADESCPALRAEAAMTGGEEVDAVVAERERDGAPTPAQLACHRVGVTYGAHLVLRLRMERLPHVIRTHGHQVRRHLPQPLRAVPEALLGRRPQCRCDGLSGGVRAEQQRHEKGAGGGGVRESSDAAHGDLPSDARQHRRELSLSARQHSPEDALQQRPHTLRHLSCYPTKAFQRRGRHIAQHPSPQLNHTSATITTNDTALARSSKYHRMHSCLRQPVHMVPKALSTEMSHIMDLIDKGYLQRGHLERIVRSRNEGVELRLHACIHCAQRLHNTAGLPRVAVAARPEQSPPHPIHFVVQQRKLRLDLRHLRPRRHLRLPRLLAQIARREVRDEVEAATLQLLPSKFEAGQYTAQQLSRDRLKQCPFPSRAPLTLRCRFAPGLQPWQHLFPGAVHEPFFC
mmetsp:Transcript_9898/g.17818  ORF Transcript_9898/g.17818 Transcript_9898/m.17818 type:complete len:436 (-) Transcript_9898:1640-2947(-)